MIPESPRCQRLIAVPERRLARWRRRLRRRRPDVVMCGLYQGHSGAHLPFAPGWYLRPPLVHPLDLHWALSPWRQARGPWRCPDGCLTNSVNRFGPVRDMHYDGKRTTVHDVKTEWWFSPCGHRYRTIQTQPEQETP